MFTKTIDRLATVLASRHFFRVCRHGPPNPRGPRPRHSNAGATTGAEQCRTAALRDGWPTYLR